MEIISIAQVVLSYVAALLLLLITNAPHVVGFVMPYAVRYISRDIKKERERQMLSFLVCFFAALLLHWKELAYGEPVLFAAYIGLIFTESNMMFKLYFSPRWKTLEEKMQENEDGVTPLVP